MWVAGETYDPLLTRAIPQCLSDEFRLVIKHQRNVQFTFTLSYIPLNITTMTDSIKKTRKSSKTFVHVIILELEDFVVQSKVLLPAFSF